MLFWAVGALAIAGCGGGGSGGNGSTGASHHAAKSTPATTAPAKATFDGPTLSNPAPEPPLVLDNYLGQKVDISSYRGRAVLLTFLYVHCPDTCPLIAANLHNALGLLGAQAKNVQLIAMSTDPKGDTPKAVAAFLAEHALTGRMQYLIGSRKQLLATGHAWGVTASAPDSHDRLNHSALIYGITASGKVTTVYPANFKPADIAHDVPLLASE